MIKNIVFDLGNVLVKFDHLSYVYSLGYEGEFAEKVTKSVYSHPIWVNIDRGDYERFEDAIADFLAQNKDDFVTEEIAHHIFKGDWRSLFHLIEDTQQYLYELKNQGYKIYILSNFGKEGFEYVRQQFSFFEATDGIVVSAHVKMVKPEREIYEYLLKAFNIKAHETIFIDDLPQNVQSANELGIHGILFTDLEDVKKKVSNLT